MPNKIETGMRKNCWKDRKLYRVLKSENVSTEINFLQRNF